MRKEMDRDLVSGYLRADGRNIVNGNGDRIILNGWGVGNWLLNEGYMWLNDDSHFDRQRRIEAVIRQLTGSGFSKFFWKEFRSRYLAEEDIRLMAELGYNSVRLPFNWRVLLEDEPGLQWIEDGFKLFDNVLDWCEEYGVYAVLDMHGAPGGQTGAQIDDTIDDMPRLFMDQDSWDKAIALWSKIAERYADRWIVGGYDLLNEPVRQESRERPHCDFAIPELARFYDEVIPAIRRYDKKHMLTLEGHYWGKTATFFAKRFDDNMCIHFHRYAWAGCAPEVYPYQEFLDVSEKLDQPLWMGETGENISEWYAAMFSLSADLNIGYCVWPWKKMQCTNSPLSVNKPKHWDKFIEYTKGGPKPSYEEAQAILSEYLENIRAKNCEPNPEVTRACFRRPGFPLRGADFDLFPGKGVSYSGTRPQPEYNPFLYRMDTHMCIKMGRIPPKRGGFYEPGWDALTLEMTHGEFAVYTARDVSEGDKLSLELVALSDAEIETSVGGRTLGTFSVNASPDVVITGCLPLPERDKVSLKVEVRRGTVQLDRILFTGVLD